MSDAEVVIVATGVANTASVAAALARAGFAARVDARPEAIAVARRVVLPGVGAFAAGVRALAATGAAAALRERFRRGAPLLAICLGMQLLFEASEESPGARGLALLPGRATRLRDEGGRVPRLGWDRIEADAGCRLLASEYACFAHSYAVAAPPPGFAVAWARHGGRYVAALERGPQLLCQFHPELSGRFGRELLARWLATGDARW